MCSSQPGLTSALKRPRKIVLMMLFSFEVDTLEVSLREQHDVVDKIFLVESSSTHKGVRIKTVIETVLKFNSRIASLSYGNC